MAYLYGTDTDYPTACFPICLLALVTPRGLLASSGALGGRRKPTMKGEWSSKRSNDDVESNSLLLALLGSGNPGLESSDVDTFTTASFSVSDDYVDNNAAADDSTVADDNDEQEEDRICRSDAFPRACEQGPPPLRGQSTASLTLPASLRSVEFWLLFATMAVSLGAALTLVNNSDAIATAAGVPSSSTSALVSLFSICNCLGRLLPWPAHVTLPRPASLAAAQLTARSKNLLIESPQP